MFTRGEFTVDNVTYGAILKHTKVESEAVLVTSGVVVSAYKVNSEGSFSYNNNRAKELVQLVLSGVKGCTSKNSTPMPFALGAMNQHEFIKTKVEYIIQLHRGEVVGAFIQSSDKRVEMEYADNVAIPNNIPYVKLTQVIKQSELAETDLDTIQTRSVQEIALEKEDVSWLQNKKYFIVNDDNVAEQLFTFLDSLADNVPIAYDTETTGLKINVFGQINSKYQHDLIKYNEEHADNPIRADKLVGIIFCVEENTSYYFPCFNRKFKNLYEETNSEVRKKIIQNTKARYTVGDLKDKTHSVAEYWRNTPDDEITPDCVLMERVRNILEKKHIVAHNGSFEYKVGLQYWIDTNLKDDTMIIHQVAYKFRGGGGKAEPSNLKYLSKHELGIDQWELHDFFPNWKPDKDGLVRRKPGTKSNLGNQIDFSYMDYEGTRVYAPTDGDCTLGLFHKFKTDLMQNHKEMEYIYNVEVLVACAIGYMEFYGHRIDMTKIMSARSHTMCNKAQYESDIRQSIDYAGPAELAAYKEMIEFRDSEKECGLSEDEFGDKLIEYVEKLEKAIAEDTEHVINIGSSAQMCDLFYNKLGYPVQGDKQSVDKKSIKALSKEKNDDGSLKYPMVTIYSKYKNEETLLSKFFDNLIYFTYPGGLIFSSFGQIATNTGRMSCSKPNCQQYPKVITKIIIPRDGYVMADADYSQIEYRVLTALAKNEWLQEMFSNPDSDYHTLMASLMYEVPYSAVTSSMRSAAKSFNFGIPYGMGLGSLAILLTGKNTPQTRDEAAEKYEQYFKNQPKTRQFFNDVKEMAQVNGYTKTLFNRYRYYSFTDKDGNVNNAKKAAALRQAGNAVIQGCLDGNTRIQTKEFGIMKIKDLAGYSGEVWDGEKWSHGDILYSGKKQKCIITFNNGQKFICSPIHKFLVRSHRGAERFVDCKDLLTKENSKNPHRIVINKGYEPSDFKYNSEWAYKYKSTANNANNVFLEDIGDSFGIGVVLGRLASDGSVLNREIGASNILQYVAEHEKCIIPELSKYMDRLGCKYNLDINRDNRSETMSRLAVYSKSLTNEVSDLDIKHSVNDNIFMDTELLRGFLRGFFDGDGGISGKTIALTFGTQFDFEDMCRDLQKALLFFGIRSRYYKYDYRYKLTIKTNDNQKFLDLIGFINKNKQDAGRQLECVKDEHIFGPCMIPESVEITDEYIDMYDVCNTDDGYYVADGIITHNTAADVFKIGVARNFSFIRRNNLFGELIIVNMVHDEQLMEINAQTLNVQRILAEVGNNMQFDIEGFPPLFIGAGIGKAWGYAKGKMAEIHPSLLEKFTKEAQSIPIWRTPEERAAQPYVDTHEVLDYFDRRVYEFRRDKIIEYLINPDNWNQIINPAIGGLINLQFTYGRGDSAKDYVGPNGETYDDNQFLQLNIASFIEEFKLESSGVKAEYFFANQTALDEKKESEEEDEYTDDEERDEDDLMEDLVEEEVKSFSMISETDKMFGSSIHDMISIFNVCILTEQKVCGINMKDLHFRRKDGIIEYLLKFICEDDDTEGLQIVFLTDTNTLNYTGQFVKGISQEELEKVYRTASSKETDFNKGDVKNRSQAK